MIIDRQPPQNLEMEQCVLGSLLIEEVAFDRLPPEFSGAHFYRDAHREIYEAMMALRTQGRPVDLMTVEEELGRRELLETCGGFTYLRNLMDAPVSAASVEYYASVVVEKALLRQILYAGTQIEYLAYQPYEDIGEVVAEAERIVSEAGQGAVAQPISLLHPVATERMAALSHRMEHRGELTGIRSGFHDLDYYTAGFQKGDLILLAARPSMGKSALAMQWAATAAQETRTVAVFSLEMSREQLTDRLLCSQSKVDANRYRVGMLSADEYYRLGQASEATRGWKLFIDDTTEVTVGEMRARARRIQAEHGLDLIVVDYLQMLGGDSRNRVTELAQIGRGLKRIARDLEVPVIALAQLSRALESRPDKRPMLSDLRESGSLEADADMVIFVYRDAYYHRDEEPGEIEEAELIIAKQRQGPTGKVVVGFQAQFARFVELDTDHEDGTRTPAPTSSAPPPLKVLPGGAPEGAIRPNFGWEESDPDDPFRNDPAPEGWDAQ